MAILALHFRDFAIVTAVLKRLKEEEEKDKPKAELEAVKAETQRLAQFQSERQSQVSRHTQQRTKFQP